MPPTGCPNAPIRSLVFLQDSAERKRMDLEGGVGLREGKWWDKLGKGVARTPSKLKAEFVRWLDFLNKLGGIFLRNDEFVEGLSRKSDNQGWMRLGWGY